MPIAKPPSSARKCPVCRKPTDEKYRPFCSKRCADVDLNRWLTGRYAIPGAPDETSDADGPSVADSGDD